MKLSSLKSSLVLAILLSLSSSGCALWPVATKPIVAVPAAPALTECPALPDVEGDVKDNTVVLPLNKAVELQQWIHQYIACTQANSVLLQGYIEKLQNRLKAVSQ
jgi:hypothetical protein